MRKTILSCHVVLVLGIIFSVGRSYSYMPLILSSEQDLLDKIHASCVSIHSSMLSFSHWEEDKMKPGWYIIEKDFTYGYGADRKKETIRFRASRIPGKKNEYYLMVYRVLNGTWVNRYGYKSDGSEKPILKFQRDSEYTYNPSKVLDVYINSSNVYDKFAKNHVYTLEDDRKKLANKISEMTVYAISKKDIYNRQLPQHIFGIESASSKYSDEQIGNFKRNLNGYNEYQTHEVVRLSAKNNLYGTLSSLMTFMTVMTGGRSASAWDDFFSTSVAYWVRKSTQYQTAKNQAITSFLQKGFLPTINLSNEIINYNSHIRGINAACKQASTQQRQQILQAMSVGEPNLLGLYPQTNPSNLTQSDYVRISSGNTGFANASTQYDLEYISYLSPLSSLLMSSRQFQRRVGTFDLHACVHDQFALGQVDYGLVQDSIQEVVETGIHTINDDVNLLLQNFSNYVPSDQLKKFIVSAPVSVRTALENRKSVPDYALVAQLIAQIYRDDSFKRHVDQGLMAVGFAGGIALGFMTAGGAPVIITSIGTVLMGTVDTVVIMRGASEIYEAYMLEKSIRRSVISKEIENEYARRQILLADAQKKDGVLNIGATVVGYGVGVGISKTVKMMSPATASKSFVYSTEDFVSAAGNLIGTDVKATVQTAQTVY